MAVQFLEGSYAEDLLKAVALCGEFPWDGIDMLGRDRTIFVRTLKKIREDGYMSVSGSAEMKTIRLTKKGLSPLLNLGEDYLNHYLGMTEGHKFRGGTKSSGNSGANQTWRRHRMAEILIMLNELDVKVWDFQKPYIDLDIHGDKLIKPDNIIFYTSRQLKNANEAEAKKFGFTRIMGLLFSPGGIYPIYHTNKGLIKWQQQGEIKAQILSENIVNCNYDYKFSKPFQASRAIMFGKNINTAIEILKSNGGRKMQNNFELLSFDNTYRNIHFITLDDNGEKQLKILMSKNWNEKLLKILFPKEYILGNNSTVDADAKMNNTFVLSFIDGDIGRLKRFTNSSLIMPEYKFEIICLPWQEAAINNYCPNIKTSVVDINKIIERF